MNIDPKLIMLTNIYGLLFLIVVVLLFIAVKNSGKRHSK